MRTSASQDVASHDTSRLALLYTLSAAVTRAEYVEEVFEPALQGIVDALSTDRASILLFDPDGVMRFKAWRGLSDGYRRAVEGHSPWKQGEKDPQAIVVEDVETAPGLSAFVPVFRSEGIRALAFVPLLYCDDLLGKFMIYFREPRGLSPEELRLSATIAAHVAQAVGRLRAAEALRETQGRLARDLADMARLHELSTMLILTEGQEPLLEEILEAAISFTSADMGSIQVYDRGRGSLKMVASRGLDDRFVEYFNGPGGAGRGVCQVALETRERVLVEEVEKSDVLLADPQTLEVVRRSGVRAAQATPLLSRSGSCVGVLSTHYRSPRRPQERQLRFLDLLARQAADFIERRGNEENLKEADLRKDRFLAMLAHELRNPLAPILTAAQLLQLQTPSEPTHQCAIEAIERQVRHLSRLVDDLLDVSRITTGKIELKREVVDLSRAVSAAVEANRSALQGKKQELKTAIEPIFLEADPTRLTQIISNLLNNAIKYSPDGATVLVGARLQGGVAEIAVRDSGPGIAGDLLPHIFDLFTQGPQTIDRSKGGLGVGLSIVKSLVDLHQGTVGVKSEVGRGTEFLVKLPALPEPPGAGRGSRDRRARPVLPRRVLVVDDNVDTAQMISLLLEASGHQVRTCFEGRLALEEVESFLPEVVLLDIGLPGMDGYEVARRIRSIPGDARRTIVALSGYGQQEDKRRALEAGFDLHLTKPVSSEELERVLDRR